MLSFSSSIRYNENGQLWDPVRSKWLVRNPEEMVRLSLLHGLHEMYSVSFRRMASERGLLKRKNLRFDVLVFNQAGEAHLLVECKSPELPLKIEHLIQLGNYNDDIRARYVMLTNGINSVAYDLKQQEFIPSLSACFPTNL